MRPQRFANCSSGLNPELRLEGEEDWRREQSRYKWRTGFYLGVCVCILRWLRAEFSGLRRSKVELSASKWSWFLEHKEDCREDTRHFSMHRESVPLFFPFRYWNPGEPYSRDTGASIDERFIAAFSGCSLGCEWMDETQSYFYPEPSTRNDLRTYLDGKWSELKWNELKNNEKWEWTIKQKDGRQKDKEDGRIMWISKK